MDAPETYFSFPLPLQLAGGVVLLAEFGLCALGALGIWQLWRDSRREHGVAYPGDPGYVDPRRPVYCGFHVHASGLRDLSPDLPPGSTAAVLVGPRRFRVAAYDGQAWRLGEGVLGDSTAAIRAARALAEANRTE